MTIKPLKDIVYLKIEKASIGVLDTSSRDSAVEYAEVIAVGEGITHLKKGDKVFVKSWAIDIVNHATGSDMVKHYFCNINSGGILAIVK